MLAVFLRLKCQRVTVGVRGREWTAHEWKEKRGRPGTQQNKTIKSFIISHSSITLLH